MQVKTILRATPTMLLGKLKELDRPQDHADLVKLVKLVNRCGFASPCWATRRSLPGYSVSIPTQMALQDALICIKSL